MALQSQPSNSVRQQTLRHFFGRHALVVAPNDTEIDHNQEDFTALPHTKKNTKKCLTIQKLLLSKVAGLEIMRPPPSCTWSAVSPSSLLQIQLVRSFWKGDNTIYFVSKNELQILCSLCARARQSY